jgi:hypothetical protein
MGKGDTYVWKLHVQEINLEKLISLEDKLLIGKVILKKGAVRSKYSGYMYGHEATMTLFRKRCNAMCDRIIRLQLKDYKSWVIGISERMRLLLLLLFFCHSSKSTS